MKNNQHLAFHLRFGDRSLIPALKQLMEKVLVPNGVDMLILEIDKAFVYEKHPEVDGGPQALSKQDARDLSLFARSLGIEIVPLFQCLGHQGWGGSRSALLTAYPEFDETPNVSLDAGWPEIFCRSWCPNHPDVNRIVYELMDEMVAAFEPRYFHIGMDEVYEIGSEQCGRCRGQDRAALFAKAVKDMHEHLAGHHGLTVMMWADRLLDAARFGYDNWEADTFGTHRAIELLPRDIVLLDWHYDEREKGYPTPGYLMNEGFRVMPACWFKEDVAVQLFQETQRAAEEQGNQSLHFGNLVTSWHGWNQFEFERFIAFTEAEPEKSSEQWRLFKTLQRVGKKIQ